MARVTADQVTAIIELPSGVDVSAFIAAATVVVNRIALADTALGDDDLLEIERWLAAHFAAIRYQRTTKEKVGDAEDNYATPAASLVGLLSTRYGQQARNLDPTGVLADMENQSRQAGITWLGQTEG